jgi:transcription elongation GreA/GreB family factor
MPTHAETHERIQSRDFEAIEDAWLDRVDRAPTDIDYFVAVAQTLDESAQLEAARPLLRLLDDELAARGELEARLELLLRSGDLYLKTAHQHQQVIGVLESLYASSAGLADMLRIAGLHQTPADTRTLQRQVERLRSLMLLDVGSLVHMEGKGVGRITEINFDLGRYKIDFERVQALTVGFIAGAKLLQPLPVGHVLRTKVEAPETLEALRDDDPSELLREVLVSYTEPMAAAEIKAVLDGVVSSEVWSRWWTAARKHPQVLVTSEKRQRYSWAASSDDAATTLIEAFEAAGLDGRLDIFTKNAKQNPALAGRMSEALAAEAEGLVAREPERALAVWLALSRAGLADGAAAFSPAAVLAAKGDAQGLAARLPQRPLRESLYEAVRESSEDWAETLVECALAEDDPGLVGKLASTLAAEDPSLLERIVERSLSRPQVHAGAFVWLAKEAADDESLRRGRELRLFRQLLAAPARPELAQHRATLGPLVESGGTLPKLVAELPEEDARAALEAVERSSLAEYLRRQLVNALELRFESLRESGGDALYALPASIAARQEEVRELREVEIPANRRAIQEAVALGDLRENFEYKSARQRHEYLSARLATLIADLARVQPIDLSELGDEQVRIGSRVVLVGDGDRREITILGPWESDPDAGCLSYQSEIGQRLVGSGRGDRVELEDGTFEVAEIHPFEP